MADPRHPGAAPAPQELARLIAPLSPSDRDRLAQLFAQITADLTASHSEIVRLNAEKVEWFGIAERHRADLTTVRAQLEQESTPDAEAVLSRCVADRDTGLNPPELSYYSVKSAIIRLCAGLSASLQQTAQAEAALTALRAELELKDKEMQELLSRVDKGVGC